MNVELSLIIPEIIIASAICLLILVNSLFSFARQYSGLIIGTLTMTICILISILFLLNVTTTNIFNDHYRIDHLAMGLKLVSYITSLIIFTGTKTNKENANSELILIELFAILGVNIPVSYTHLRAHET